ncbi:MAG: methylglutaconyl-CoA hydratase [Parasphingorhabdus sp.]|jgi:methylglutaconyl-CoA hydratase
MYTGIELNFAENGVATLELNRPEIHNAFDDAMIANLNNAMQEIASRGNVNLLVLKGRGKSFSAGADLNWMKRMSNYDHDQNLQDAMSLASMLQRLNELPCTSIAAVQGAAMGGGVGLASCCDYVIATASAKFALSEVRLGLLPATISPYVIAAIGQRQSRRYMLTGERFGTIEAHRIGLVHEICEDECLEQRTQEVVRQFLQCGPQARKATKSLIRNVADQSIDQELLQYTAGQIASIRSTDEGREGVAAFLNRRKPDW